MKSAALRRFYEATGFTVMRAAVLINIAALLGIIGLIVVNAWPAMTWEFLTEPPRDLMTKGGILPCIIGTFCLALGALVIALPLGVASAVYLKEYSQPSVWVTLTRLSIANLAGVPSIVFGLFGLTFFVVFCGFGVSLLSGILTLAVLSLPIILNKGAAESPLTVESLTPSLLHISTQRPVSRSAPRSVKPRSRWCCRTRCPAF